MDSDSSNSEYESNKERAKAEFAQKAKEGKYVNGSVWTAYSIVFAAMAVVPLVGIGSFFLWLLLTTPESVKDGPSWFLWSMPLIFFAGALFVVYDRYKKYKRDVLFWS